MAFVVTARYVAQEGEAETIAEHLREMARLTNQEPGCRFYAAHRSPENPSEFFLYEQYEDETAFQAHVAADYFVARIKGEVIPRLAERERRDYEPLI